MSDNTNPASIGVQRRAATDVGGTFTDLVVFSRDPESGATTIETAKSSTTPPDFDQGVLDVFADLDVSLPDVRAHVHGTTVVINALTERKGATVGLIATEGFRDTLEIARGNRPDFFNLDYEKPPVFVPRALRREVPGRLTYRGEERSQLDVSGVGAIVDHFRANGVEAIAVCLLHSWANPEHERRVCDEVRRLWPEVAVVASSDLTREWREYERTSTAVLSAFVQPVAERYLRRLDERLTAAGLSDPTLVMQSNGGVSSIDAVAQAPIAMVESGPASGFFGAARLGRLIGEPNVLAIDIGGTTAKCSLIEDGQVRVMTDYWIGRNRTSSGYPAMVPVVDLIEIGNGGGSIARVDEFGKLHVGPQSAGARPGPVSYGQGGTEATTTDANLWLGRIGTDDFCGGSIIPDLAATEVALTAIGDGLGTDAAGAARGVVRIANNNMINALKLVSINRGHDPRHFTMVAFGGGGPMHAVALAKELGVRRVVVPNTAAVFSAWGMVMSDVRRDAFVTALHDLDETSIGVVATRFAELEAGASEQLAPDLGDGQAPTFQRLLKLRYQGQEHATEVPVDGDELTTARVEDVRERFRTVFEAEYTYRLDAPVEVVGLHLIATAPSGATPPDPEPLGPPDAGPARTGTRMVDFADDGRHEAAIYDLTALAPGMTFAGPAIAEGDGTSIVVHPGATARVDGHHNVVIDLEPELDPIPATRGD
ncbi:MAG: hydantoinase/oxoprolinase family protein [Actinomycetota bacterium]